MDTHDLDADFRSPVPFRVDGESPAGVGRRVALAGITAVALAPAIGCSSGGSRRRYASSGGGAGSPSVNWPDLPARGTSAGSNLSRRGPEPSRLPARETSVVHGRREWASTGVIPRRMDRMQPVRRLTVHHDGMPPVDLRSRSEVAARIDLIRRSHMERGWGDIGYHYIVDPMGEVWEGRPLSWQGAHVAAQNEGNLGVMVLGNFERQQPTSAQLSALDRFVASRVSAYRLGVSSVLTHRELAATACPGRNLQAHMSRTRGPHGRLAMLASGRSLG